MGFEIVSDRRVTADRDLDGLVGPLVKGEYRMKDVSDARNSSDVDVSVCTVCQGVGVVTEEYNHRRMERSCTHCSGRGVQVIRNRQLVPEAPSASTRAAVQRSDRKKRLSAKMDDLQQRIAEHTKERSSNQAALGTAADATERALRQELMQQLDKQLQALEGAAARARARLATLSAP